MPKETPPEDKPAAEKTLTDGFNRFRDKHYENGAGLMEKLVKNGANPDFFIINCIDPRNGADIVFDAPPGQQFLHQQMGAIIPPYDADKQAELAASLSYAIDAKKIKHLVIMGHSQCGGVGALVEGTSDTLIESWVKMAAEAKRAAEGKVGKTDKEALLRETERQTVIMSVKNALEYPMVKKAVAEGRLTVSGWYFDMEKGALHDYDPKKDAFTQIAPAPAAQKARAKHARRRPPHYPPPRKAA
ncbi:MAG: hypothetical protein KGL10_05625 [Alphaproteobacteria bacterium]|nr:hypothetical protein [Alphaproteobacteria bacterium]MDE2336773.1 hypothetical protein [Alphaproteobacteria bacterium]